MTEIVKQARRYYYGVFEEPKDPITKIDKTFVPLIESTVEGIVKAVDVDTKDVWLMPNKLKSIIPIKLLRFLVIKFLDLLQFGQFINDFIRVMVIDGTAIAKITKSYHRGIAKMIPRLTIVDRLNFFIDPAADNLQDADTIERLLFKPSDFKKYKNVWKNTDKAMKVEGVSKLADRGTSILNANPVSTKQIEVFERWGVGKKGWRLSFNDGVEFDDNNKEHMEEEYQTITTSGDGSGSQAVTIHSIKENKSKNNWKPYEESWYRRMRNRWDGRGVPEQLFMLQEYTNTIWNIRKNNALILQNGIFLVRKGSPITPQMVSSIYAGGMLPVANIDKDIKQLPVQDVRQSSYTDEDRGALWADRVSGARKADEVLSASTPATIGLIQQQNQRDIFDLIQEGIGFWLERVLNRHLIPMMIDDIDNNKLEQITGDVKQLEELDEMIIEKMLDEAKLKFFNKTGFMPDEFQLEDERVKARKELKKLGNNRFMIFKRSSFMDVPQVRVVLNNEKMDKALIVQSLRDILVTHSRLPGSTLDPDKVLSEMNSILGLNIDMFKRKEDAVSNSPAQANMLGGTRGPRINQELPAGPPTIAGVQANAQGLPNAGLQR